MYAPTSSSTEDEIESFYGELEEAIENSNKRDYLIVTGEWNAQIGGNTVSNWKDVVGG